jgi:DNA topoisomerase-1
MAGPHRARHARAHGVLDLGRLAVEVDLRYSTDAEPGIVRHRTGRGFHYLGPDGASIREAVTLARIRALAIPPAWHDVWICPDARGHLQAAGRDARGRKQSRYHPAWRARRDESKFGRMAAFGRALPRVRRRVSQDLALPALSKEKVLATLVRLLETTSMRIGSEEYARANGSFGLTTLRNRHVTVSGAALRFRFRGKGGKIHVVGVHDRRLTRVVTRCEALPGQELFQYLDEDGEPRPIESADVNGYLQEAAGIPITAKDFRTWIGTLIAFQALRSQPGPHAAVGRPRATVVRAAEAVAEVLGNTPAVSRQSYIAPLVVEAYLAGSLPRSRSRRPDPGEQAAHPIGRREELALVHFLERGRRSIANMR